MNSMTQIKLRKYKTQYSAEMTRPEEYVTENRNKRPRVIGYFRMDRICWGIRMDRVEVNRRIALRAITAIQATEITFQMSKWAWLVSIPAAANDDLNCGG